MARAQSTPVVHVFYPSVSSALANLERPYTLKSNQERVDGYRFDALNRPDWHGLSGGSANVFKAIRNGFPEGEVLVRSIHDEIAPTLPRAIGVNRVRVRGDQGDDLDVHAVNRGAVDKAWSRAVRRVRVGSSIVRLCIDIGGNCHTNADALRWRGVAGLALAEVMGKAGYSVELVACFAVRNAIANNRSHVTVSTVIKPRSAQADLGLLAATATLSGFFRVLGFAGVIRGADDLGKPVESGLGRYLDVSGVLPAPDKVTTLFVQGNTVYDRETAVTWVRQSVALLQGSRI